MFLSEQITFLGWAMAFERFARATGSSDLEEYIGSGETDARHFDDLLEILHRSTGIFGIRQKTGISVAHSIICGSQAPLPAWSSACRLLSQAVLLETHVQCHSSSEHMLYKNAHFARKEGMRERVLIARVNLYTTAICSVFWVSNRT